MNFGRPRAIVYVDGLNLCRQKIAFHPDLKWLNLLALAQNMLPTHEIKLIRYFTARVKPAASSEQSPIRQTIYLRALKTLGDKLTIHEGLMRVDTRNYPVVPIRVDEHGALITCKVRKIEEKGSDVALASHMILDASRQLADVYVLISSDSDFAPTLRILTEDLGVATGLFSPIDKPSTSLLAEKPLFTKVIRRGYLENSQFDVVLQDSVGKFHRPAEWS